jgi:hypothetical protein
MLRIIVTTHPVIIKLGADPSHMIVSPYDHVMSTTTQGVVFADDCFLMDTLPLVLRVATDSLKSFRADADLALQPAKFNIHIKGVSHEHAQELTEKCIQVDRDDFLCLHTASDTRIIISSLTLSFSRARQVSRAKYIGINAWIHTYDYAVVG